MKAIVRISDGLVSCMWEHGGDGLFGVPEGHEIVEIDETLEQFERRVGGTQGKGAPEFVGGRLRCRAPESPLTIAGEIGRARKARGARADDPVTLAELEAAEASLEKRRQG